MFFDVNSSNFRLYGKSSQNGIPTLHNPVSIHSSYEDEELTFRVEVDGEYKRYKIKLEGGLRGLEAHKDVSNYIDENNKPWICDEIDLDRGVYIQRVGVINTKDFTDIEDLSNSVANLKIQTDNYEPLWLLIPFCTELCTGAVINIDWSSPTYGEFSHTTSQINFGVETNLTRDEMIEFFMNNQYELLYPLLTPIETPLPIDYTPDLDYEKRMNEYYPEVVRSIEEFQAIIKSEYLNFEDLARNTMETQNNAYLSTMDESRIVEWEKVLNIKPMSNSTLVDRKSTIIARLRGYGKLNTSLINSIVNAFTGGTANSWVDGSVLYVEITPPPNNKQFKFENVEQELKKKLPAHLTLNVSRNYYTWGEINNTFTSWSDMKNTLKTWNDVLLPTSSK